MEATVWIKVAAKKRYQSWYSGTIHASKTKPTTQDNEVAVRIILDIPDSIFEEPVFEAKFKIPETKRILPDTTEIAKHVGAELSKHMGFRVKLDMTSGAEANGES